ncbi:MAG: hypothetical protein KA712_01990 [Myxococcales bacterium]|nr:hypothetical protein [Myxococcales bacterium]
MQRFSWALVVWGLLTGCNDEPCDPGQLYRDGLCFPAPADAAMKADGLAEEAGTTGAYGRTCVDDVSHADCQAPAPVCLKPPGQTAGFCSAVACDATPEICPSGWRCVDLASFVPGAPWACVPL